MLAIMDIEESLVIRDRAGQPKIVLSANERLPFISLGGKGEAEIHLEIDGGSPRITMRRPSGTPSAVIASREEALSIIAFDIEGRRRAQLVVHLDRPKVHCEMLDEHAATVRRFEV